MKKQPNPITNARVQTRSAQEAERRAAVANKELLRWDVARERQPHTPSLAHQWAHEDLYAIQAAQREAHRVMDVIDAMRPANTVQPETRAIQVEEHIQPMDAVVEDIRIQPSRFDLHAIALVQRVIVALGLIALFLAGVAVGKAF